MSLYESLESNGSISLRSMFNDPKYDFDGSASTLSVERLIFAVCRGGWPVSLNEMSDEVRLLIARDYVNVICDEDISRVDGRLRNPVLSRLIIRSYARNPCSLAKKTMMSADVTAEMETTTMSTFDDYVQTLERLFVIEDIEAWWPAIRSKSMIRTGKKRCFTDPSIAVAVMGASPETLEMDQKTFGFMYEYLCIRDLRVYSQALGRRLSYYHNRLGLEADAVLQWMMAGMR